LWRREPPELAAYITIIPALLSSFENSCILLIGKYMITRIHQASRIEEERIERAAAALNGATVLEEYSI
jgi:hypothetical protein